MQRFLFWFTLLFIILPIAIGTVKGWASGWPASWRNANWGSSGVLPEATSVPEAQVIILSARTGRWKSIFAEHMSIVLKPEGASEWTRYDVVGWGNPVRKDAYAADAFWYGNTPRIAFQLDGAEAESLIPRIEETIASYPHSQSGSYTVWPGPNSNSFVSYVVRHTEGFAAELPSVAIGKDWIGGGFAMAEAPSKSGWTVSLHGLAGLTLARAEGLELHLLGSTIGLDPASLAVKLPALGTLSLLDIMPSPRT